MKNTSTKRVGIYWFKHDLRLDDNLAFDKLAKQVDKLICVFIIDPRWFRPGHFQSAHLGKFRWQFLRESLADLSRQLNEMGQRLLVFEGRPNSILADLLPKNHVKFVSCGRHPGVYERQQWKRLQLAFPEVIFEQSENHCLFSQSQLPFDLFELPDSFTPFRKKVESISIEPSHRMTSSLPPPANCASSYPVVKIADAEARENGFKGGTLQGLAQLQYYLSDSHSVKTYKQTRNGLDGWDYSSKFSPWLANGSISAKTIFHELKRYESQHGDNESTYWLYFELLWREYFQWYLFKHESALFKFEGVKKRKPLTTFMVERFAKWKHGETPYPIVNACIKQLNQTGYMSNRGRQLVASCLVHELGIDWRYGAAYFEQQLIDFDVASNWGNWQYLAGVGADPRGHRRFDLDKQTRQYDPQEAFIKRWQGEQNLSPLDTTDAADWPV